MRWIYAFAGAMAVGGLGACAVISGIGDYSDGTGTVDGSVHPVAVDGGHPTDAGTPLVDGRSEADGTLLGDDSGSSPEGGCEALDTIQNCGACGNACDTVHSLGATCVGGTCVYTSCLPGWGECEADAGVNTNGCETSLSSVTNCGQCGVVCDTTHSMGPNCDGTTCSYAGCNSGFVDCDQTPPDRDGCERSAATIGCSACGDAGCDTMHSSGGSCVASDAGASSCKYGSCASGYADCNKAPPDVNGCETPITTTANCGGCGRACNTKTGTPTCSGSACTYACSAGLRDCNAATAPNTDGCECSTPGCCGTSCETTHSNGVGGGFSDCTSTGTHNDQQAKKACESFAGGGNCSSSTACCSSFFGICIGKQPQSYCGTVNGSCKCWQYQGGDFTGTVQNGGANCKASCGASGDPTWN